VNAGAEGAASAAVDTTRVCNVRKGYNRIRVTTSSTATFEGYYYLAGTTKTVPLPATTVQTSESGKVSLECLRNRNDYSSRDSSRTVLSNTTVIYRLPLNNPARCRISVSLSAYNSDSDLTVPGSDLVVAKATYSLVRFQVESVK